MISENENGNISNQSFSFNFLFSFQDLKIDATFELAFDNNIENLNPLNYNEKDLNKWFDSVIYFFTKITLICFLFAGNSLWNLSVFPIFGTLIVFDVFQIFTILMHYFSNSFGLIKFLG